MTAHLSYLSVILLSLSQIKGNDQITRTTLSPGEDFTMSWAVDKTDNGVFYFYKISIESLVQTVAEGYYEKISLKGNFNHPRFRIHQTKENQVYSFTIFNVTREDEASYVCQAGSAYKMRFIKTTLLIILDQVSHTFYVKQIPQVSAPLGGPVQLNCSLVSKNNSPLQCPSKRNMYWFRSGAEESPGNIIYTYKDQTEEPLRNQRTCVYSLSRTIQDVNDTGTYYCAVATCGHVLFGLGTRVEISSGHAPGIVIILAVLLSLCLFVIAVLIYSRKEQD